MSAFSSRLRLALSVMVALSALLAACSSRPSPVPTPTSQPATASPAPPPAPAPTPTPVPEDLGQGSVELIRRGWEAIVDYHIAEPEAKAVLSAAWQAAAAEARRRGAAVPAAPVLSGEREEMWAEFAASYLALLQAIPRETWDQLRFATMEGMAKSLNDCHTFFLQPQRSEALTDVRTGRGSGGIGVELAPVKPSYVRETISGGPAQRAGILPGDYLLAVDDRDVSALGIEVINDLLRGDPGSPVSVQVRRPSNGAVMTFPLTRALVQPPVASGRVLPDGIGYIRLRSFTANGTLLEPLDKLVEDFEAEGVFGWVIDLRDNPGGDSDLDLDGRFIGRQVAERLTLRDGGAEVNEANGDPYPGHPIAVLVNGGTASVGEIFASMLQDYGRGRVFGTPTAKCAGFVSLNSYPDGSTLAVTIARALTPKTGRPLWQTGVIPDQIVRQTQEDLAANRDPVLDAAIAWLNTQSR